MRAIRHSAVLIAGATLIMSLPGCDSSGPTSEAFSASLSGTSVVAPGGRCPALTLTITAPGTSTPGGAFTTTQSHCIDPAGANPLLFSSGLYTFTYAAGKNLSGTYSGTLVPTAVATVFTLNGTFTITGGNGEFAGATGGGNASGTTDLATGAATVNLVGTIVR